MTLQRSRSVLHFRVDGRLETARDEGAKEVEIVSDSELLVRQMLGVYRVKHPNLVTIYTAGETDDGAGGDGCDFFRREPAIVDA